MGPGVSRFLPSVVRIRGLPAPDTIDFDVPEGQVCLVTDDGTDLAVEIVHRMAQRGWPVAVLGFPDLSGSDGRSRFPDGIATVMAQGIEEQAVAEALGAIRSRCGEISVCVCCASRSSRDVSEDALLDPRGQTYLRIAFTVAKGLQQPLTRAARSGRAGFVTVTAMDGELGLSGWRGETPATTEGEVSRWDTSHNGGRDDTAERRLQWCSGPVAGGLAGLAKTLRLEWPGVFCRAVDLDPAIDAARGADLILAELLDPNRLITEVGYGPRGRVTLVAETQRRGEGETWRSEEGEDGPNPSDPNRNTVFLVSGGAKGITADCVVALAQRYKSSFILAGRSAYDGGREPSWAEGAADEAALKRAAMAYLTGTGSRPTPREVQRAAAGVLAQREIGGTLEAVAAAGGRAVYVAADVTDREALSGAVAKAARDVGAINGIIHGAGVLADKLVHQKSLADFDRVVSVKVDGLRNLLACVPRARLDYLVLFSSVAAFYGNVGQADYATANEVLNKAAHWVRAHAPHCRVVAVDWGPWDGGMVTPELKRQLALRAIDVIPVGDGTRTLAALLQAGDDNRESHTQVVVGSPLLPSQRDALPEDVPTSEDAGTPMQTYHIRRRLTLEQNPFLVDHVIGGRAVLPTVCAVSWMVNACEQLYPGYRFLRVDDYCVLKGVVFDQDLADAYTLDLTTRPTADGRRNGLVQLDTLIRSRRADGLPRYHYRARVTLQPGPQAGPIAEAWEDRGQAILPGRSLYHDGTLFHGPSFQGIDAILDIDASGLTMKASLPPMPPRDQGQFVVQTFNPFLIDVQLQSLLVWAKRYVGHGGLPLRIAQGIQYRPLPFGEATVTSMRVRSHSALSLVADVEIRDGAGALCMEVKGAEITLSARLNELFLQNRLDAVHTELPAPV